MPRVDGPADLVPERLRDVVGPAHVLTDPGTTEGYRTDWMGRVGGDPVAVVRPGTTEEVAEVLRVCADEGVGVVPQGGNTGLVGAGIPRGGEVVLSLRRLDRIDAVDPVTASVTVGAGATLADVQAAAARHDLTVGVDLASRGSATIGGMIATNAGGIHVVAHGPMRQHVRGLEAVLADGTVLRRQGALMKDNAGLDLPQLLTGSEGTLAVITAATLSLVPVPTATTLALVGCADVADALDLLAACRRIGAIRAVELMHHNGLAMAASHLGAPLPLDTPVIVLVERLGADTGPLAEAVGARPAVLAQDAADARRLWRFRESHTEALAAGRPLKLDVALPLDQLAGFLTELGQVGGEAVVFGHLAEGNLHVNLLAPPQGATDRVLRLVAAHDGSIAAEHGVGVDKAPWLHLSRDPGELAAMRRIKAALDPDGLLNPGVMLADESTPER